MRLCAAVQWILRSEDRKHALFGHFIEFVSVGLKISISWKIDFRWKTHLWKEKCCHFYRVLKGIHQKKFIKNCIFCDIYLASSVLTKLHRKLPEYSKTQFADFDAKNDQNWENWSKTQIAKTCGKNGSKLVKIRKKLLSAKANF